MVFFVTWNELRALPRPPDGVLCTVSVPRTDYRHPTRYGLSFIHLFYKIEMTLLIPEHRAPQPVSSYVLVQAW